MQTSLKTNLETIRRNIAERLRPSCATMSEEEFDKLVSRMALIEWKHHNDATPTSQMLPLYSQAEPPLP